MTDTIARKIEDTIKGSLSTARGRESKAIAHKLAADILALPYDGICVIQETGELSRSNRPMTLGEALDIMPGAIRLATRILPVANACLIEKKNKARTNKHTRRTHHTAKKEAR